MSTKKISSDDPCSCDKKPCSHPEHNPPGMRVYSPGTYLHTCPGCGNEQTFVVHASHWCGPVCGWGRGAA